MSASALLLIGHGSTRYPDAGRLLCDHARVLREGGPFAQIEAAFLNGSPKVEEALARIQAPTVRVVPFFMEEGHFTRVAVPRALGSSRRVTICPPIGLHDGMAGLIERQALAGFDRLGVPSRAGAVVVVGHGSASLPGRALALHRHASRVAATELFARVEPACLEEAPFVPDVLGGLRAHPVVVIGYLANEGRHVRDDLPAWIARERSSRGDVNAPVDFAGIITADPRVRQIIIDNALAPDSED